MDERMIIQGLAHIGLAVGERLTDERTAVYVEALRDLKNEGVFADAVDALVNNMTHFPKIPDFREAYFSALNRQPKQPALGGGNETEVQERDRFEWQAAQAAKIVDTLAANDGSLMRSMDAVKWPQGPWRRKNCIEQPYSRIVYSDPELPGGGVPAARRPPFGDRS